MTAIRALEDDQHPSGVLKLAGRAATWGMRVGEYGIIYTVSDQLETVFIEAVVRRTTQTYRRLG